MSLDDGFSAIALGTAQYGSQLGADESFPLLDRFAELGGTFIDTAHVYGAWDAAGVNGGCGNSEAVIGQWLRANGNRASVRIGTKGGHPDFASKAPRLTRDDVLRELDESLARLQTDYVDLYWLHRDDRAQPVGDILSWLEAPLVDGRVRAVGCSHWRVDRLREAMEHPAVCASQIACSLAQSSWTQSEGPYGEQLAMDGETALFHRETQLPLVAYNTQAMGFFAEKYDGMGMEDLPAGMGKRYGSAENAARRTAAVDLAKAKGCSTNQIALAYLLHRPFPVRAIVGPKNTDQLTDSMAAARMALTEDELAALGT